MSWKEEIKNKVAKLVDQLDSDLSNTQKEIDTAKGELHQIIAEYTDLQKEIAENRSHLSKQLAFVAREKNEIEKNKEDLKADERRFSKEASLIQEELIKNKDQTKELEAEIKERKKDLKSVAILEKQKETLVKELGNLSSDLSTKGESLRLIEHDIEQAVKDREDMISQVEEINADLIADLDKRKNDVVKRENALSDREKKVTKKETDLVTIEKRFKRLYQEKGANFKV